MEKYFVKSVGTLMRAMKLKVRRSVDSKTVLRVEDWRIDCGPAGV